MIPISPGEAALAQAALFDTTITVYGEGSGGAFDAVVPEGNAVAARFVHLSRASAATAADRAELAALRELRWDPAFLLPETAQVADSAGVRWNPTPGTFAQRPVYRSADVVRVV
jgi:hypothetical protein